MSITSETQRKYDPNKGGFSYYTLFHADKGERPSWAQDGDMLEEFGEGGKAYVCSRDTKGRIKWTEKADWDRQTGGGSGGEGLPADFPAEGIANANKYIGFDAKGDYEAKSAPSGGGGAEKFVVTLTADDSGAETVWTADKTIAEIVAAYDAGQIVVASVPTEGVSVEVPCILAVDDPITACAFSGAVSLELSLVSFVNVFGNDSGSDSWDVRYLDKRLVPSYSSSNNGQVLGVSSGDLAWVDNYAPLIVTLTEDAQNPGTYVGDKTFGEVYAAVSAGKTVYIYAMGGYAILNACSLESGICTIVGAAEGMTFAGTENDYLTFTGG